MLDMKFVRDNIDLVRRAIEVKGAEVDLTRLLELDTEIRSHAIRIQELRTRRNELSSLFPNADAEKKKVFAQESKSINAELSVMERENRHAQAAMRQLALLLPAVPDECAPVGPDESANVMVKTVGALPRFEFEPLDHVDLVNKNGWADLRKPTEISGARTFALKGDLARLELALINYAVALLEEEGFTLITVPPFAREAAFEGTGHFPVGKEDAYSLPDDDLYLIGTSEVVLNSMHAGEILEEADLPILYAGYSNCYRREAGNGGRDVRGLLRVHHFTKIEQFVICKNDPAESRRWHQKLLHIAERILADLELPYQIVECSTGDMGLGKFRMHDIESWVPSLDTYRETHSCSTLHDWQSRRTNTRYRNSEAGIVEFAHTLNNTAVATPRIFASFLEVHQWPDGHVRIPIALRPFLNGREFI